MHKVTIVEAVMSSIRSLNVRRYLSPYLVPSVEGFGSHSPDKGFTSDEQPDDFIDCLIKSLTTPALKTYRLNSARKLQSYDVRLTDDLAEAFPNPEAVNEALRRV